MQRHTPCHTIQPRLLPAVAAFVVLFTFLGIAARAEEAQRSIPVRLEVPPIGSVQWIERTTGELLAPRRAVLKMKVSGILDKVPVREGDRVSRGQQLAGLDMVDATLALDQATSGAKAIETQIEASRALLESAKVGRKQAEIRLDTATRDFERAKSLRAKDTIPQQQFDQIEGQFRLATSGIEAAEKQVAQAQAALESAKAQLGVANVGIRVSKQRLADSLLLAPFDGLVAVKTMMEHEQSNDQTITLIDDSHLELQARLPERFLPLIGTGTSLLLKSPLCEEPAKTVIGTIIPAIDPKTLSFTIKAQLPNADHRLSHGGYVDVEVIVREDTQVPVVPAEAVRFEPGTEGSSSAADGSRKGSVFTVSEGKARKTPVTVGLSRNNRISVLSGLASGTPIIVVGASAVTDGAIVEVQK